MPLWTTIRLLRPGIEDDIAFGVSDDAAKPILIDWLQRHPLQHNLKVRFIQQAVDAGDGTSYLLYMMYIEQEEYGVFGINPDTADIIMDSLLDSQGNLETIQVLMDQWYLEYYWGWTDDSGYYSAPYTEDIYEVYNGEGALILEYYPSNDFYAICDYDGQNFLEYDDRTVASEVSISDFAGTYWCDQSGEVEGTFVEKGYALEIEEVNDDYFSIAET